VAASRWVTRLTQLENRFLDWARSPDANGAADAPAAGCLDDFRGRKYCVLITYRKSGQAVPSPLWFGVGDGKIYAHTAGAKVRRIERDPRIRVAPSTFRGRPLSAPLEGHARVLTSGTESDAERRIQANYGMARRLYYRLLGQTEVGTYLEIIPTSPSR
jgi:PPOX class probable F420-dependent enzyme